jgi:hypothetical protein
VVSGSDDQSVKIWEAASGECLLTIWNLPEHESAGIANGKVVAASPGAWRWLGWRWTDPATGRMRILPAEHFGPLP